MITRHLSSAASVPAQVESGDQSNQHIRRRARMERAGDIISVQRDGNRLTLVQRDLHEHVSTADAIRVRRQRRERLQQYLSCQTSRTPRNPRLPPYSAFWKTANSRALSARSAKAHWAHPESRRAGYRPNREHIEPFCRIQVPVHRCLPTAWSYTTFSPTPIAGLSGSQ